MLEKEIEQAACKWAVNNGWMQLKFVSPAHRSVPDRMFIKEGRIVFIEFKKPGGKLTDGQTREIARLRAAGADVFVCDSVAGAKEVLTRQPYPWVCGEVSE